MLDIRSRVVADNILSKIIDVVSRDSEDIFLNNDDTKVLVERLLKRREDRWVLYEEGDITEEEYYNGNIDLTSIINLLFIDILMNEEDFYNVGYDEANYRVIYRRSGYEKPQSDNQLVVAFRENDDSFIAHGCSRVDYDDRERLLHLDESKNIFKTAESALRFLQMNALYIDSDLLKEKELPENNLVSDIDTLNMLPKNTVLMDHRGGYARCIGWDHKAESNAFRRTWSNGEDISESMLSVLDKKYLIIMTPEKYLSNMEILKPY